MLWDVNAFLEFSTLQPINCKVKRYHTINPNLTAPYPGLPGWANTKRWNQSGFYSNNRQWVAVASAGPYASLHLAPDTTTPAPHRSVFTGRITLTAAQPTASKHRRLWLKLEVVRESTRVRRPSLTRSASLIVAVHAGVRPSSFSDKSYHHHHHHRFQFQAARPMKQDRQTNIQNNDRKNVKTYRNKKTHRQKIHSDKLYNSDNCQNTDSWHNAQLSGCCSSCVDVNKTLTHFSSRCQS